MDDEPKPAEDHVPVDNSELKSIVNEQIQRYEKQLNNSFDFLLRRLKDTRDLSNGDHISEFLEARQKEFVKKVNHLKKIFQDDFRNDIVNLIAKKYSNNITVFIENRQDATADASFDEMVDLFNQLKITGSEISHTTYSDVIDLLKNLKVSDDNVLYSGTIESLERLTWSSKHPGGFHFEMPDERDEELEIFKDIVVVDIDENLGSSMFNYSISDDDLISGSDSNGGNSIEKYSCKQDSDLRVEKSTVENSIIQCNSDFRHENDVIIENDPNKGIDFENLRVEKISTDSNFIFEQHESSGIETDHEKLAIKKAPEFELFSTIDGDHVYLHKSANLIDNFTNEREKGISYGTSQDKLKLMMNCRLEINKFQPISNRIVSTLQSNDVLRDKILIDQNANQIEPFTKENKESNDGSSELGDFQNKVMRWFTPDKFFAFRSPLDCSQCKQAFETEDELNLHNSSERHKLKFAYLRDRSWFAKELDHLKIQGIPDVQLNLNVTKTYEILLKNISNDASNIFIHNVFELVHVPEIETVYKSCLFYLELDDIFKMTIKAKYDFCTETIYPIVFKLSINDNKNFYYLLIEPRFKAVRRAANRFEISSKKNTVANISSLKEEKFNNTSTKPYRPFLKIANSLETKNPTERRIIDDSFKAKRCIIPNNSNAFRSIEKRSVFGERRKTKGVAQRKLPSQRIESCDEEDVLCAPRIQRAREIPKLNLAKHTIPPILRFLVNCGFKTTKINYSPIEMHLLKKIKKLLCEKGSSRISHNKDALTVDNYVERFHFLMWIEECQSLEEVQSFNQKNVELLIDKIGEELVGISLPGLSEGRPSVMKGDRILLTPKLPITPLNFKKCEGSIQLIEETSIYLNLHRTFYSEKYWKFNADVEFLLNRTPIKMSHTALDNIRVTKWQDRLFPDLYEQSPKLVEIRSFFNDSIARNELQVQAVRNIVQNRAYPAPYILFGPPGTGKTATLVEAITQVYSIFETSHICVCASSNTAADVIAKRLLRYIPFTDIIRIYGLSRNDADIISELHGCCNYDPFLNEVFFPSLNELRTKRIVVMTPVTAGRFILKGINFDYIFMDEAGHALEVDVLIPISGFLRNPLCSLILAGDPKQLGPVVRSPVAIASGLGMSLLERLMTQCDIYKKDLASGKFNPKVITKLVNNYRSHESILRIPNERFYDNELEAKASEEMICSLCKWKELPSKGFPIIFHSVKGVEEKENNSPSYFNSEEVNVVVNYVHKLFDSKDVEIKQNDVGIISPYRKQVQKIRQRLSRFSNINVASVEEFQGQERKIIIISTVRSRHELLATDYKYGLGFLKNEKRFNVAITRAVALLIVIGNPDILQCDPNWRAFLQYCTENSAFVGKPAEGSVPDDFNPNQDQDMYLDGFQI